MPPLFRVHLLATLLFLGCPSSLLSLSAQELLLTEVRLDEEGRPVVRFTPDHGYYYILYRGDDVNQVVVPMDVVLGDRADAVRDPEPATFEARFYRVQQVSILAPLDLDEDGMDDVYELERAPLLHPLRPMDAFEDLDGDYRTNLDEYRLGTDPFLSDIRAPTVVQPLSATSSTSMDLTGTAMPGGYVRVEGGASVRTNTVAVDGTFSVTIPLKPNRLNRLFVSTVDPSGSTSIGQPIEVLQDSQPPTLFLDFPTNTMVLTASEITVAGRVGDSLSGYNGLSVWVHSSPSEGTPPLATSTFPADSPLAATVDVGIGPNGTYERGPVPLAEGANILTVVTTDALGNRTLRQANVVRRAPEGPHLAVLSGDRQMTNALRRLGLPLVIQARQPDGTPLSDAVLVFEITRSDGRLLPVVPEHLAADWTTQPNANTNGAMRLELRTDTAGEARAWWTLGSDAGCANNRVCVTGAGLNAAVYLCASAFGHPARQINIGSGNHQKAEANALAPEPLRAWVSDGLNPAAGIPVTFRIIQGGGRLVPGGRDGTPQAARVASDGAAPDRRVLTDPAEENEPIEMTVLTGVTGHASIGFIAGPNGGQNLIEASFPGQFGLPATFTVYGLTRDLTRTGTFTGLVLDNTSCPVGHAYCELEVANYRVGTYTDIQGRFRYENVPGGMGHLHVNGATATNLFNMAIPTNSFPSLHYSVVTVANAENALPTPVLLPRLNPRNAHVYTGTNDLVLTVEGMDGLKMTIAANSMKHPDGTRVTPERPAVVSLDQVHHDDVPMPMPDGVAPPFAWTLQPGGATFDPPVRVEYPNMSGLAPGSIAYFLSFNHDTERFEIVSSGSVTEDGSTIVTDPDSGLTLAGWGCNCPPYAVTGDCVQCIGEKGQIKSLGMQDSREVTHHNVFQDSAITIGPPNLNACGAAHFSKSIIVDCDCDPNNDNLQTLAKIEFKVIVDYQWYAGWITEASDIADVTRHEAEHVAIMEKFAMKWQNIASHVNGVNYSSEQSCYSAVQMFQQDFLTDWRMQAYPHQLIDNIWEEISCFWLKLKYGRIQKSLHSFQRKAMVFDSDFVLNSIIPDEWSFTIEGTTVSQNSNRVKIRNITVQDQFGATGPGSAPDFIGDSFARVIGISSSAGTNRYAFSEYFQIRQGETISINDLTFTDTPPRQAENLRIETSSRTIRVGTTHPLVVIAQYADGSMADVTLSTLWTGYRLSNPSLASISRNGVLTPHSEGTLYVTAMNEGASTVLGFTLVEADTSLTTVVGTVVDVDGRPIPGARVVVYGIESDAVFTDDLGRFSVANVPTTVLPLSLSVRTIVDGKSLVAALRLDAISSPIHDSGTLVARGRGILAGPRAGVGGGFSAALRDDGTLYTWGLNGHGQLGTGNFERQSYPQPVREDYRWISVATGSDHMVGLRDDWTIWTWGNNGSGQLGLGSYVSTNAPQQVTTQGWGAVAAGVSHTLAIDAEGNLWAWGGNSLGQLGVDDPLGSPAPVRVTSNLRWEAISAGSVHSAALLNDGTLWTWGANGTGQLGRDSASTSSGSPGVVIPDATWRSVSAGSYHTAAIRDDRTLWTWGQNTHGQLGTGAFVPVTRPVQIGHDRLWNSVSAGNELTIAVDIDGQAWAFGTFRYGNNGTWQSLLPLPISTMGDGKLVSASVGNTHALLLDEMGFLWALGDAISQPLGTVPIFWEAKSKPSILSSGGNHNLLLLDGGEIWVWGANKHGQLGTGTFGNSNRLSRIEGTNVWRRVAAGHTHSLAIDEDGSLWSWGGNEFGQLGNGTTNIVNRPERINSGPDWMEVSAGFAHSMALRADGSLWTWGGNYFGQLGDGGSAGSLEPRRISDESRWRSISAGVEHSLAIRDDGILWGWGLNNFGQLGIGSFANAALPQAVQTNVAWRFVSGGYLHTLAVRSDGTLWSWGANGVGQLGSGVFGSTANPWIVSNESHWVEVRAGYQHSLALKADGSIWSWGDGTHGKLGRPLANDARVPRIMVGQVRWPLAGAGQHHTVACSVDGQLHLWGDNAFGQIGQPWPWEPHLVKGGAIWGAPR